MKLEQGSPTNNMTELVFTNVHAFASTEKDLRRILGFASLKSSVSCIVHGQLDVHIWSLCAVNMCDVCQFSINLLRFASQDFLKVLLVLGSD